MIINVQSRIKWARRIVYFDFGIFFLIFDTTYREDLICSYFVSLFLAFPTVAMFGDENIFDSHSSIIESPYLFIPAPVARSHECAINAKDAALKFA